jgi:catechol 2,3-dioxygenase-like lactoylglutathione lyase family enzyme
MIDHVILKVGDLAVSRGFFEKALEPLGYKVNMEFPNGVAFGRDTPELGIAEGKPVHTGVHLAFTSPDRKTVDAFYRAALDGGGKDNGPPGLRPNYHPDYYGAFVLDPDGNNIEAVCHRPG